METENAIFTIHFYKLTKIMMKRDVDLIPVNVLSANLTNILLFPTPANKQIND